MRRMRLDRENSTGKALEQKGAETRGDTGREPAWPPDGTGAEVVGKLGV